MHVRRGISVLGLVSPGSLILQRLASCKLGEAETIIPQMGSVLTRLYGICNLSKLVWGWGEEATLRFLSKPYGKTWESELQKTLKNL